MGKVKFTNAVSYSFLSHFNKNKIAKSKVLRYECTKMYTKCNQDDCTKSSQHSIANNCNLQCI